VDLSSFSELLRRQAPELLPVNRSGPVDAVPSGALPHGTTIVAVKFPGGVLIAGDRRSTQGNMIAGRDVQKVYVTDDYTATGIAGTAAIAVEFARLYAVELEHYEKLEGVPLTFAGKVNRLAIMVRGNLGAALQGFVKRAGNLFQTAKKKLREFRLFAKVGLETPRSRNKVAGMAQGEFLHLTLELVKDLEAVTAQSATVSVFAANFRSLLDHISNDTPVGGLPASMVAVVYKKFPHVPNATP